jgi:hypothetical protein
VDTGLDSARIQHAEDAIELVGTFADASIGRLAESQPFADYISDLVGTRIAAIIDTDGDAAANHESEPITSEARTIKAVVAVYEVEVSPNRFGAAATTYPRTVRVRPASLAVLECISAGTVVRRLREGPYEYLLLADGTALRGCIDETRWSRISFLTRFLVFGE